MKIPLEWLKEYVPVKKDVREVAGSFTAIGLMLDKPITIYESGKYKTEVLDLEHRMDRSDWLSILGCARDYAAFEGLPLKSLKLNTKKAKKPDKKDMVDIKVMCPDLVRRFNTRVIKRIKVKPSPAWLKNRLEAYGIPSINNIVDITNYVMVELGQPMHAQDLAKMRKREIVIRRATKGETLVTLLGEKVNLDSECFVLTQEGIPTVLGGIVGGQETGIDETTTEIVLDAGNYNQTAIRKTSRRLKIQNETVLRYDKFLNPELTELAINRAVAMILELAGGDYYENIDWHPKKSKDKTMTLRLARLEKLSGMNLDRSAVKRILAALGYTVTKVTTDTITVTVPFFRTDVEVEDDLVADVLRINGYSKIPSAAINAAPPKEITPAIYRFEEKLRDILVSLGLHEHITDPMVNYTPSNKLQVKLENAQSSEKNALRVNLDTTLANVSGSYLKAGIYEGGLFEIGKIYNQKGADSAKYENYEEMRYLTVFFFMEPIDWERTLEKVKSNLRGLLRELGIATYKVKSGKDGKVIVVNGVEIGSITLNSFSLNTEALIREQGKNIRVVANRPSTKKDDISINAPVEFKIGDLYHTVLNYSKDFLDVIVRSEQVEEGKNYYLLTIEHTNQDFRAIRDTLVKEITSKFPQVTIR